jgi:hypothetical protein
MRPSSPCTGTRVHYRGVRKGESTRETRHGGRLLRGTGSPDPGSTARTRVRQDVRAPVCSVARVHHPSRKPCWKPEEVEGGAEGAARFGCGGDEMPATGASSLPSDSAARRRLPGEATADRDERAAPARRRRTAAKTARSEARQRRCLRFLWLAALRKALRFFFADVEGAVRAFVGLLRARRGGARCLAACQVFTDLMREPSDSTRSRTSTLVAPSRAARRLALAYFSRNSLGNKVVFAISRFRKFPWK